MQHAHERGLLVIDDSKRNDIGNTAKAYAFAHLAKDGPVNADFLTVLPFGGSDSLQPFVDAATQDGKGLFVLVKTSNPGSVEISEAINGNGQKNSEWLASYVHTAGRHCRGALGYSSIGAVVGATFPKKAKRLRELMKDSFVLVPGFGAQGGNAKDVVSCFNENGLGAVVNSSRDILYHYLKMKDHNGSREAYLDIVRRQALDMQQAVYSELKSVCPGMVY